MRVCVVYDCLFPYTVGGAERWYVNLAERLAQEGHEVTYVTRRQWDRGEHPQLAAGVRLVSVAPRIPLYTADGRRRIDEAVVFGLGVLWHLVRHGRSYDVVHTASFPYFSVLAAGAVRRLAGFRIVVDWHEVWSDTYWREYLGGAGGLIGRVVQRLCARVPQRAFCFSRLHAARLREAGLRGEATVLSGEYAGPLAPSPPVEPQPVVLFAGRLIREKQAPLGVAAVALAAQRVPGLRGVFFGDGPEREALHTAIAEHGAKAFIKAPGFVDSGVLEGELAQAMCMLLPSRREGYGMVVVEASAHGVPSVVVAGEDNAAVELVADGLNGFVVQDGDVASLADAIVRVHELGPALRERTARWFGDHAEDLSIDSSVAVVLREYGAAHGG
jgi:glycosyltransferase involved in cell wall biosynthesis